MSSFDAFGVDGEDLHASSNQNLDGFSDYGVAPGGGGHFGRDFPADGLVSESPEEI